MMAPATRGILLVVAAPSGTGKTTLCRRLVREFAALSFSISYTTRPPRHTEKDGVDYHFVDDAGFERMVAEDRFAEWAWVHGHRYGTARQTVEERLGAGLDLVFDIDWQGATRLSACYPDEAVTVFVLPPSMTELSRRLRGRRTEADAVIARRLRAAEDELAHHAEFQYLLVNDDLEQAYDGLRAIYVAARLRRTRQARLAEQLLAEVTRPGP